MFSEVWPYCACKGEQLPRELCATNPPRIDGWDGASFRGNIRELWHASHPRLESPSSCLTGMFPRRVQQEA